MKVIADDVSLAGETLERKERVREMLDESQETS